MMYTYKLHNIVHQYISILKSKKQNLIIISPSKKIIEGPLGLSHCSNHLKYILIF